MVGLEWAFLTHKGKSEGLVKTPCINVFLVPFEAVLKLSILIYFLTIIIIMDYDNGNGSKRSKQNLTDMAKEPKYINTYSVSHFLTVWLRTSYIKSWHSVFYLYNANQIVSSLCYEWNWQTFFKELSTLPWCEWNTRFPSPSLFHFIPFYFLFTHILWNSWKNE